MKITKTEVWGFKHAIRGMRNPLNSWEKSDSIEPMYCDKCFFIDNCMEEVMSECFNIGEADLKLAQTLIKAGGEHRKFLRMIHVSCDIEMPRYYWSESDTYSFKTQNSCSTMHKLLNNDKQITYEMFASCEEDLDVFDKIVPRLEDMRCEYKKIQATTKNAEEMNRLLLRAKRLLPEGFLQLRTWDSNYETLRNMYFQRKNHKLKEEWQDVFCKWVESLPYAKELILYTGDVAK